MNYNDFMRGVMFGGGSGGGGGKAEDCDFVHFGGEDKITLPFEVTHTRNFIVDFQPDAYNNFMVIAGNTWGGTAPQLTMYGNLYYYYNGSAQATFQGDFTSRHVFNSCINGYATFDNTQLGEVALKDKLNYYFAVGFRGADSGAGTAFVGRIFKYTIMDNGTKICELVPKRIRAATNGFEIIIYGLFDTVNNAFYSVSSGGDLT